MELQLTKIGAEGEAGTRGKVVVVKD